MEIRPILGAFDGTGGHAGAEDTAVAGRGRLLAVGVSLTTAELRDARRQTRCPGNAATPATSPRSPARCNTSGRAAKTMHLLDYCNDQPFRRRILTQLNRGKLRHALARDVATATAASSAIATAKAKKNSSARLA